MIRFYFNNSYKGSLTGFQQSWISTQGEKLDFIRKDVPISSLTRSAMRNGGVQCAAGRCKNGYFFVIRGVQTEDTEGRLWYVNMGVEAGLKDRETFSRLVHKILVEHDTFVEAMRNWFFPADGALSYRIDAEMLWAFMDAPCNGTIGDTFYKKGNYYVMVLRHFLKDLENGLTHRLNFLVPEQSTEYFHKMNPVFEGCYSAYTMGAVQFQLLLHRDCRLYDAEVPKAPWKYIPVPDSEQLVKIRKGVGIGFKIVCAAAVLSAACRIANVIMEEDHK